MVRSKSLPKDLNMRSKTSRSGVGHGPPAAVVKEVITKWKEPSGEFQTFVINR